MKGLRWRCLWVALLTAVVLSAQQPEGRKRVEILAADFMKSLSVSDRTGNRLIGHVKLLHNEALMTCDSAYFYSSNTIEAFGHVHIIKNSTHLYGDTLYYDGDQSLARVRGKLVRLEDSSAILRTFNLDYNTKSNVAYFFGDGTLADKENVLESKKGYYYSDLKLAKFHGAVEMHNDTYDIKSDSLHYYTKTETALFLSYTSIWHRDGYLSCKSGWYDRPRDYFHFAEDAYVLSEKQEIWSDSIFYDRPIGKSDLYGNIQLLDTTRSLLVFGDEAHLLNEEEATVIRDPSLAYYEKKEDENHQVKYDTLFLRADTLKYISMKNPVLYPPPPDSVQLAVDSMQLAVDSTQLAADSVQLAVDSTQLAVDSTQFSVEALHATPPQAVDSMQPAVDSMQLAVDSMQLAVDSVQLAVDSMQFSAEALHATPPQAVDSVQLAVDSMQLAVDSVQLAVDSMQFSAEALHATPPQAVDSVQLAVDSTQLAVDSVQLAVDSVQLAVDSTHLAVDSVQLAVDSVQLAVDSTHLAVEALHATPPQAVDSVQLAVDSVQLAVDSMQLATDTASVARSPFPVLLDSIPVLLDSIAPLPDSVHLAAEALHATPLQTADWPLPTADSIPVPPDTARCMPATGLAVLDSLQKDLRRLRSEIPKKTPSPVSSAMFTRNPAADSSITETPPAVDSVLQYFYAYRAVKIYRDDGQAVCDSMVFFVNDTLTEMFYNPVLWNENHQISSDKVRFISKDSALHHAEFLGAAFMVSEEDTMHYNQIKSRDMYAYFRNNEVYLLDIIANVQTVFFGDEDSVLVNINFAESVNMKIFIKDRKVSKVVYYKELKNDLHPLDDMPSEKQRLKGFAWQDALRPKTRYDVCTRAVKPSQRATVSTIARPTFPITKKIDAMKIMN